MSWLFVAGAILSEVTGSLSLKVASSGRRRWYVVVVVGYVVAFVFLGAALSAGIPLGVAYGIWAAAGVALTAIASRVIFHEPLTPTMIGGIALIIVGVLLIELGSAG